MLPSGITGPAEGLIVSSYSTRCPHCWVRSHTYSTVDFLPNDAQDEPQLRPWWKFWA